MKKILLTGATAALLVTTQLALAAPSRMPICLPTRNIASTSPAPDGTAITFRMTGWFGMAQRSSGALPGPEMERLCLVDRQPDGDGVRE